MRSTISMMSGAEDERIAVCTAVRHLSPRDGIFFPRMLATFLSASGVFRARKS